MPWFDSEGTSPSFVLYSTASYRRNLAKLPFSQEASSEKLAKIDALLTENGFHKEILKKDDLPFILSLGEKQFFDRDMTLSSSESYLYLNEPCNLALTVGGEDCFSIRAIISGKAVKESKKTAATAEELLDKNFTLAYSDKFGYLTQDPLRCGSAFELSCALFLPALFSLSEKDAHIASLAMSGLTLTPFTCHKDNPGGIYILSYRVPAYISEDAAIAFFEESLSCLITKEEDARKELFSDKELYYDLSFRAYGILTNAKMISEAELLSLLSDIRLGIFLGERSLKLGYRELLRLMSECLNGSVVCCEPSACQSERDCDILRARRVKMLISGDNNSEQ